MSAFNLAQLASYDEARALRDYLNSTQQFAANQILSGDDETAPVPVVNPNFPWLPPVTPRVGIYLPPWVAGPHADPEPNEGKALFLHFRFANGREGFNIGLMIDKFKRFGTDANSVSYVLRALAAEAAS